MYERSGFSLCEYFGCKRCRYRKRCSERRPKTLKATKNKLNSAPKKS